MYIIMVTYASIHLLFICQLPIIVYVSVMYVCMYLTIIYASMYVCIYCSWFSLILCCGFFRVNFLFGALTNLFLSCFLQLSVTLLTLSYFLFPSFSLSLWGNNANPVFYYLLFIIEHNLNWCWSFLCSWTLQSEMMGKPRIGSDIEQGGGLKEERKEYRIQGLNFSVHFFSSSFVLSYPNHPSLLGDFHLRWSPSSKCSKGSGGNFFLRGI